MDDAMGDQEPPSRDLTNGTLSPNGLVKTSEFIRLILDALNSLGFNAIATDLEKQSGVPLLSPATKQFLELVKNREWDKSIDALKGLELLGGGGDDKAVRLLLLEEKVFELMSNAEHDDAEKIVRDEMRPLGVKKSCLIRITKRLFRKGSVKDGAEVVMKKLQELLPVGVSSIRMLDGFCFQTQVRMCSSC